MNIVPEADRKGQELVCLLFGFLVFFSSLVLAGFYTEGDQANYHSAYDILPGLSLDDAWNLYTFRISAIEPVHFLVSLFGSNLEIDKNLLMAVCNGILATYLMQLFLRWGADIRIAAAIVCTNFYVFVLYFAAERLKFGLIFFVLALLCTGNPIRMAFFALMSILSHVSLLIVWLGSWLSQLFAKAERGGLQSGSSWLTLVLTAALVIVFLVFESDYLIWKLGSYVAAKGAFSFTALVPVLILTGFSCFYSKRLIMPVLSFLPVMTGILILGSSRLNMLGYFIFLYYGLRVNGGLNLGVVSTLTYLAYKAFGLASNIILHGHGFP